jgi:hypothetical protein
MTAPRRLLSPSSIFPPPWYWNWGGSQRVTRHFANSTDAPSALYYRLNAIGICRARCSLPRLGVNKSIGLHAQVITAAVYCTPFKCYSLLWRINELGPATSMKNSLIKTPSNTNVIYLWNNVLFTTCSLFREKRSFLWNNVLFTTRSLFREKSSFLLFRNQWTLYTTLYVSAKQKFIL